MNIVVGGTRASKEPVPKLRPGINLAKAGLSMEEGIIASRVDGVTPISGIAILVGKSKADTEHILNRLQTAGVIEIVGGESRVDPAVTTRTAAAPLGRPSDSIKATARASEAKSEAKSEASGRVAFSKPVPKPTGEKGEQFDYGTFIFPPALMGEPGVLAPEERKRIIFFHENLARWTHYELLQVARRDDAKAVKKAYFLRSKEWHPDRFRRGDVGSFRKMIDAIYRRVKEAHDVLSDSDRRAEYDETCVFAADEADLAEMLEHQRRQEREKKREEEAVERRRRRNPIFQRMGQAKTLFEQALEKEKRGELKAALRTAQTAAVMDGRPEYAELVERLKGAVGESRITPYLRSGSALELQQRWVEACETYREVLRIQSENGIAHLRLAQCLLRLNEDAQEMSMHATKAATILADDPEAHLVLGLCYEKGGLEKAAIRAYQRAVELNPDSEEAKRRLKKLKWGF